MKRCVGPWPCSVKHASPSEVITRTGELWLGLTVLRDGPNSLAADRHQLLGYPLIRELS